MFYEAITAPGQIGSLEVRNRITLSPMEKNWCDRLGNPTRRYVDYSMPAASSFRRSRPRQAPARSWSSAAAWREWRRLGWPPSGAMT